jgi:hypothetical protein
MPWYEQSGAFRRRAAFNQASMAFARPDGDLLLSKPVRSAILASQRPGIWRMSDQTICGRRGASK